MNRPTRLGLLASAVALLAVSACGYRAADEAAVTAAPLLISLRSDAFPEGTTIPAKYTCDAENISPPLSWSGEPIKAKSFVLICDDPDAPVGTFTHWLVYNLPPQLTELPEGLPPRETVPLTLPDGSTRDALQGKNDFGKIGYGGPCPPGGTHHYIFRLYAMDSMLAVKPGASRAGLLTAMKGHILAQGRLMGTYSR
jgi:Raf kinase inhibitor-like YbhB/YbcL family protein